MCVCRCAALPTGGYLAVTEPLLSRYMEFRSRIMRSMRSEPLITASAGTPILTTDSCDVTSLHQPLFVTSRPSVTALCLCVCVACVRACV